MHRRRAVLPPATVPPVTAPAATSKWSSHDHDRDDEFNYAHYCDDRHCHCHCHSHPIAPAAPATQSIAYAPAADTLPTVAAARPGAALARRDAPRVSSSLASAAPAGAHLARYE
ncbi:hypothetical protein CAOG_08427 [Capsaspora owczarzaki ATCC 30864]|uniref:hypothetical protein n=1 Tax=Capsaspora owczarzaki (strain ATCC 30864) TaxID=595528 RepID=UPI0003526711|nr:hypothetical protein CAOG_08427 [Capsaspora owczarzaki ATCC 30864]|eukprot:XP_011269998.1 hypothetical protein CAOG_08427 [Capsaspora owczarzaki ATCC 30864]